jgi:asparagine synthase (glutamine-hydrolysing)
MSFQFGMWHFDAQDPSSELRISRDLVAAHGPDGQHCYCNGGVQIVYSAFHTTSESPHERQPYASQSGKVITWDGRLDNRADLIRHFGKPLNAESPDVAIAGVAYDQWGTAAFTRLTGDWSVSIWDPIVRELLLAKDVIGVRRLYWCITGNHVSWSTLLDAIVVAEELQPPFNEEYIAGWFSHYPASDLTPYPKLHSVLPGSFVRVRPRSSTVAIYSRFEPLRAIRYRSDAEYEEHFRHAFAESVKRRLRSNRAVLAELSGGMDSSSIVCAADNLIATGNAETPRLDTLSFYDPSEPNWDERPYFTKVEALRGRTGFHIDVSRTNMSLPGLCESIAGNTPNDCARDSEESAAVAECLMANGNRVVLSGVGGDEMLGGVPTPLPELADLLVRARFLRLARQLTAWGIAIRQPCLFLLFDACRQFFPPNIGHTASIHATEWLNPRFVEQYRVVLGGYEQRLELFGPLPSFQENVSTLRALQRQLQCTSKRTTHPHEVCYPYLDRDFLEFLFALPREQLIRPGRRRSLMRRALTGIVPTEILERKRKAFILRAPVVAVAKNWTAIEAFTQTMVSEEMGVVDAKTFRKVLARIRDGQVVPMVPVIRTLLIEYWLRGAAARHKAVAPASNAVEVQDAAEYIRQGA